MYMFMYIHSIYVMELLLLHMSCIQFDFFWYEITGISIVTHYSVFISHLLSEILIISTIRCVLVSEH